MISQTSLEAYRTIVGDGRQFKQRQKILIAVQRCPGATRHDISEITGVPINAVCGRVSELIHDREIEEKEKKLRPETGVHAFALYAVNVEDLKNSLKEPEPMGESDGQIQLP